ncbi:multifunctional CCA tRNA nucleotidyl transferase/2'3'-cyclic phosphodiesterase/2'nucleotidase/phosphatase [Marinobacter sp. 1Y8]
MEIYLVGGAVRDALLGRSVKDRDWVVVGAKPEEMISQGFRQVGADFPVFLHPGTQEEYALARTERKQGHGYHGFDVHSAPDVTLEDDLLRRDLTINAMAQADDGRIVDPFAGQQDLEQRLLRHVSPAFAEDPLRILRTARFAARFAPLEFTVADETLALMRTMVDDGEVDYLVPERVWTEMQRAMLETAPRVFFEILHQCGALERLIPALADALAADDQALRALTAAAQLSHNITVRYAALIAGLGDQDAVRALSDKLKAPNDCRELAMILSAQQDILLHPETTTAETLLGLFNQSDAWRRPERFAELQVAAEALAQARGLKVDTDKIKAALCAAQSVEPRELMAEGYKGPELGKAIQKARLDRIASAIHSPPQGRSK